MTLQSNPIRVLVIDDDAMSRELLAVVLEAEGYAVESADSGEASIAHLKQMDDLPQLILTDMQMPGISGPDLAMQLRHACGSSTLLLAVSGSQPPAGSIANFDGFLLKPFKVTEIAAALSAHRPKPLEVPVSNSIPAPASAPKRASKLHMSSQLQETQPAPSALAEIISSSPVLNEKIYQQLTVTMPEKQLHQMYTMCVDDARKRITLMRGLINTHDSARFSREAHAIKGSCGMLGATQLHGMASELEKQGLEPAQTNSQRDVNSLDELSAACDRLERMLGSRV